MPSRKVYRKSRKDRKSRKNRKQYGGNPMAQSLAQGQQFANIHSAQHGGAYLSGAPLSEIDGSMLAPELRSFARVESLDASINDAAAQGPDQTTQMPAQMPEQMTTQMPAQSGGRRNRKSRKSRKSRKNRKSERKNRKSERKNRKSCRKSERKNRKSCRKSGRKNRKSRRQQGGSLAGAPVTWESKFLSDSDAAKAGTADFSNPLLKI